MLLNVGARQLRSPSPRSRFGPAEHNGLHSIQQVFLERNARAPTNFNCHPAQFSCCTRVAPKPTVAGDQAGPRTFLPLATGAKPPEQESLRRPPRNQQAATSCLGRSTRRVSLTLKRGSTRDFADGPTPGTVLVLQVSTALPAARLDPWPHTPGRRCRVPDPRRYPTGGVTGASWAS
jgi:hypothetical protein